MSQRKPNQATHGNLDTSGFALVIALSLMAFVLLLILSLTTFVRVESSAAKIQMEQLAARQNARLAAFVALGDLQRTMGPDMRVSARADLLSTGPLRDDPEPGTPPFDPNPASRFWTGVWRGDAWNPGDPNDRQGRFLGWLISMTPEERETLTSADSLPFPLSPEESVPVAAMRLPDASGGGNEEVEVEVRAPLRELGDRGDYAWWVSDEGVKANPGTTDPFGGERASDPVEDIPRFLFPHRPGTAATDWFENTDFTQADFVDRLRRVTSAGNAPWLAFAGTDVSPEAEAALREDSLLADFSFRTHGVLSDSRRGGLRRDLSLALWRDPNERHSLGHSAAFTPNAGFEADFRNHRIFDKEDYPQSSQSIRSLFASGRSFFGPRWEVLRDYHNSFQKLIDPTDLDTALRIFDPNLGQPLYDTPRSRSVDLWQSSAYRGRIVVPEIIGGRLSLDVIERGGEAAEPGQQIEAADSHPFGAQPAEVTTNGLYPLLQRASLFFNLDMREVPDPNDPTNTLHAPRINAYTIIHFWNPHNVTLTSVDPLGGQDPGDWLVSIVSDVEFTIERQDSSGSTLESVTFNYDQLRMSEVFRLNPGFDTTLSIGRTEFRPKAGPESFKFRPGEIRAFVMQGTTKTEDVADGVLAGVLEPYFTSPRAFIPYEKTGGPLIDWGANERTNDPFLFEADDRIRIRLGLKRQVDLSTRGFRLQSAPVRSYNRSFTQAFSRLWIDPSDVPVFEDIINVSNFPPDPVELGGVQARMKAADTATGNFPARVLANFNVRALYNKTQMGTYADLQPPNWEVRFLSGDPFNSTAWNFETIGGKTLLRGFWGASDTASGDSFVSLFDVPRRPPESIGQYQHAHLAIYPHQPTYPVGNSLADPHVSREAVIDRPNGQTQMDLSWLLNDNLWDRYFLSTIDPNRPVDGRPAPLRERFVELDPSADYAISDPETYRDVASNLLLRGAFNVNSTSEEAWAAFLGRLGGEGPRYFDTQNNAPSTVQDLEFPFFRHTVPNDGADTAWRGGPRDLSRAEIRRLASEMVEQVRQRGPFLSLSDFVNRRLSADDRGLKGAIQAAIDNANLQSADTGGDPAALPGAPEPAHAQGNQADLAPGNLSQADVLTAIGPAMSVRSDTFVIRAYGRSNNSVTGRKNAESWVEMLVQRTPDTADPRFGRPFRILSVRWLNEDEI